MADDKPKPAPGRYSNDRPYTQAELDTVRHLHAEGHGRNEISRRTGIHGRKVSAIAAQLGLTFVRGEQIKAATEAKKVDARARRAELAEKLLVDAERLRQSLWAPCVAYNFGGKDNTFEQAPLLEPSFRDKREIMTAIGVAVDRAVRLDEYDKDTGVGDAKSMLGALAAGLGAAYEQLKQTDGTGS